MIKLVALDLDGTLLNSDKNISEGNKKAIKRAKEKGVKIVLCTGRPLLGIKRYLDELGLLEEGDYAITYNGGLVQKNNTSEILSQKTLSYQHIKELYELSQTLQIPMNMIDLESVYEPEYPLNRESLYPSLMSSSLPFINKNIESFHVNHQFNKVVYCIDPVILDQAIKQIPDEVKSRYSMMKSRPLLFEIMHPEVDKGSGIETLCKLLGFTRDEVMACGDEENDLAMLQYAGVAVAMENASDFVKQQATFISKSNDEDGIAHAFNEYIF
ncbi:sugar-phosphatase [Jeotgalibaca sp. MA1X17-3]|uniref:sugar-phosphatase n=1 Tax=Jeotgalibaca sp. MA1X17-3 TaxID=2908211 RepID=UPI001F1687E6|nr:sugar-phosphatase [Jeotgalibaca sp. MA1X17-3]UJF14928.1 sugar-phosphatase [Jeotgalibaca sp. MA1X17-3]